MRLPGFLALIIPVFICLSSSSLAGETSANTKSVKPTGITYLSGTTVYVNAGRSQGLMIGQKLQVVRDGEAIGWLEVKNLSSNRASCTKPDGDVFQVGDTIVYTPQALPETEVQPGTVPPRRSRRESRPWLRRNGFRGRLGIRYLLMKDRSGVGEDFSQPALNARLTGSDISGSGFDFLLDARTRRTYRTRISGKTETDSRTRIYRLSLSRKLGNGPLLVSAGRQVSPDLASVSIFDGFLTEYEAGRLSTGVFVGTQPAPASFGYSNDILEYGLYGRIENRAKAATRWALTSGAISSRTKGESNRDYLFLRGRLSNARLTGFASQEVDYNHGWKTAAGESPLSITSTLLNLRYRFGRQVSVYSGFDNRRNIRLYRDGESPETEFDDSYRLGWSAGSSIEPVSSLRIGLGMRTYDGAGGERSNSYTATLRLRRLTRYRLSLSSRHTRYDGPQVNGWLHSGSIEGRFFAKAHVGLHGGLRDEDRLNPEPVRNIVRWYGTDIDFDVARGVFFLLSFQGTRGETESNNQLYSSLSYRF